MPRDRTSMVVLLGLFTLAVVGIVTVFGESLLAVVAQNVPGRP